MQRSKEAGRARRTAESPPIREPDVFADSVGYYVVELFNAYSRLIAGRTHSALLNLNTTQWRTLTVIRFNPGQTQHALSRRIGIDPSSMTPIINLLERKGWVRRHRSPTNRSAYGVRMTAAGTSAYRTVELEMGRSERLIAEILGAQGQRDLSKLLQKLHKALVEQLAAPGA